MKSSNTFGVHYVLRHQDKTTKLFIIYARIVVNGSRGEMTLKCRIPKEDWNSVRGAAKPKTDDLRDLNLYLDEVRSKFLALYKEMELKDELLTADLLKERFLGKDIDEEIMTLTGALKMHYNLMSSRLELGTLKNYKTTLTYVQKYCAAHYPSKDIYLKHLDVKFIVAMESYIPSHPIKKNKPCTRNGLMKHMERLKKISAWAVTMGWIEKDPFIPYKLKFKHKDPVFLTIEELSGIENFRFQNEKTELVADLFIFSCYTGLDYGDLMDLNEDNIGKDPQGNTWIYTNRNKTEVRVVVPMLTPALAIYEKYRSVVTGMGRSTLFPWVSNQESNRQLKVIALIRGITKRLIFKTARHTFATTVTLLNGVPIESISKMLGHSKLSTTMIYTHITHAKIGLDMSILQGKIDASKQTVPVGLPKAS